MNRLYLFFLGFMSLSGITQASVSITSFDHADKTITKHTTNADNLTSGTVAYERMPIGSSENTVATGSDIRFYATPTSQPNVTTPDNIVLVCFE